MPANSAEALAARAGALRAFGVMSPHQPFAAFDARERAAAAALWEGLYPADRPLLTRFIFQSRQYVLVSGDAGITGWWNPFVRAWVIGVWHRSRGGWTLLRLTPILARDLSGAPTGAPAASFLEIDRTAVARFQAMAVGGQLGSLQRTPRQLGAARVAIVTRQRRLVYDLEQSARQSGFERCHRQFMDSLAGGSAAQALPTQSRETLAALPENVRASLIFAQVSSAPEGLVFAAQSPLAPGVILLVHFQRTDNGPAQLSRIDAVSLNRPRT